MVRLIVLRHFMLDLRRYGLATCCMSAKASSAAYADAPEPATQTKLGQVLAMGIHANLSRLHEIVGAFKRFLEDMFCTCP
jgi:hypothetical protein